MKNREERESHQLTSIILNTILLRSLPQPQATRPPLPETKLQSAQMGCIAGIRLFDGKSYARARTRMHAPYSWTRRTHARAQGYTRPRIHGLKRCTLAQFKPEERKKRCTRVHEARALLLPMIRGQNNARAYTGCKCCTDSRGLQVDHKRRCDSRGLQVDNTLNDTGRNRIETWEASSES
jgi:hypothetical protein